MTYSFSTFTFSSRSLELTREGRRVAIEPQPARALALLVSRAGEVVSRDELRQAIWGADTHVDYDRGLAYCVGQVRAALGDSAEHPRFVQTLPKRGFRFIAPVAGPSAPAPAPPSPAAVEPLTPPPQRVRPVARAGRRRWPALVTAAVLLAVAWLVWPAASPRRSVVAVSIFDNETGDAAHDGFVAGLSDVVVTELSALAPDRVGVVGNAAPLRQPRNIRNLKALAASLEADYLVLGQLQRQNDDLRVIVHFIRLDDGVHLSARRFVRPPVQVADFERDVIAEARRVVEDHLLGPSPSSSPTATR